MSKEFQIEIKYNKFPQLAVKFPQAVGDIVKQAASDVEAQAKSQLYEGHGVDTGNLKNSIQWDMTGDTTAEVSANTEYAVYVEYGHHSFSGYGYMTKGAEAVRPSFIGALKQLESKLR
jgi:phage gpG-like protein